MDIKKLVNTLHPLERKVLPLLKEHKELKSIISNSKLKEVEVMRALQWLENKNILKIITEKKKIISLDSLGKKYAASDLPERLFLNAIGNKAITLSQIKHESQLSDQELNVCLGLLKKKVAINIKKDKEMLISLTDQGMKILTKYLPEEEFLKKLKEPLELKDIKDIDKLAYNNLKKRKQIIKTEEIKTRKIKLTDLGEKILKQKLELDLIETLTPEIIRNQTWKKKPFREYDIKINVPAIQRGKRHLVDEAIQRIKRIWLDLGFKEMEGDIIQTSFWDLDSLFVPQDHPAREMQDTFYLKEKNKISLGKLPKELTKKVKEVHEKGWQTKWNENIAKEILLRTHTTVLSAHTLSKLKKEDLPAKFFTIGKVYRNETLDWKHLFEFYQIEGIVVDPNANFKHLIGYLKEFYKKMGFTKIRIRPFFFPYTFLSCEIEAYHPEKKQWIELGGAGIFRPEVTKPLLGFECPVLAWGQGMERIITDYYKIEDLRDLYKNDIKQLREIKAWI